MAQSQTLLGLILLLPLLLLPWAPTRAGPGKVVVLAPNEVHDSLGSTVTLPCHLQPLESEIPRVTQIRWTRLDQLGDPSIVAEFHWERGPSIPEPDRVEFVAVEVGQNLLDASLTIHGLWPEDEANYTCEFQSTTNQITTYQISTFHRDIRKACTWLRVF